ncbi:MAG: PAS domain S-box protein [Verrucomicrobiota bacterium]
MSGELDPHRLARHLAMLSESVRDFAAMTTDSEKLLPRIAGRIAESLGDSCSLWLLSDDERTLTLVARRHLAEPALSVISSPVSVLEVEREPFIAAALEAGKIALIADATAPGLRESASPTSLEIIQRLGIRSLIVAPLVASGRRVGLLLLARSHQHSPPFDELDRSLAQTLADHAALAIANARAFREQRLAREALNQADRVLFELSPMAMFVLDRELLHPTAVNEAALALYGYERDEFLALPVEELRSDGNRAQARAALDRLGEGTIANSGATTHRRKDGSPMTVEYLSCVATFRNRPSVISAVVDVTERNRVRETQARLAAIVDSSEDAIVTKTLDGVVETWNRGAERLFGYAASEMIGRPILLLLPAERHHEETDILRRLGRGERISHFETIRVHKDGRRLDVSAAISPLYDHAGRVCGASTVVRDISDRRRVEEQGRQIGALDLENQRIQEATRLKSQFLANMSHELRTPLNGIIGFAELLRAGKIGPVSEEQEEYLGDILTGGRHLLKLINEVLDLSRVEAGRLELRPEPVDLAALIGEVRDTLRVLAAERRIHTAVEVDDAVARPIVDPDKLKQVLYNYLANALKFTPDGGRVTTRARREGDALFRIEVEDTGIGIPAHELDRLFVEFQQLDSGTAKRFQGTGLGLALTKKLVEAQGGRVGVTSTPGHGSTFFAVLPLRPRTEADRSETRGQP